MVDGEIAAQRSGHVEQWAVGRVLRFVVLSHDWPEPHGDMLIEHPPGAALLPTWSLDEPPGHAALEARVERLADHRRAYLDYEGPVQGGRGRVSQSLTGQMILLESSLPPNQLHFQVDGVSRTGQAVQGELRLWRNESESWQSRFKHRTDADSDWMMTWCPKP